MRTLHGMLCAGLLATACGSEVVDQQEDASTTGTGASAGEGGNGGAGEGGNGGAGEGGSGGADEGGAMPDPFCTDACSTPSVEGGCFTKDDCDAACNAEVGEWSPDVRAAFAACAAEDPLCFITLEGCMLGHLGEARTVRYQGSGFDAFNGRTLRVSLADTEVRDEATIQNGSFDFAWTGAFEVFDQNGPLVIAYIDMNTNDACDAASDVTMSDFTVWTGDFNDITYAVAVTPPDQPSDFVCQSF